MFYPRPIVASIQPRILPLSMLLIHRRTLPHIHQ
jgi:hypothetical protein